MHIDARNLENNTTIKGDICIVGAGAAGISMALDWIGSSHTVILLEGGGFEYDNEVQDLYKGETTGQPYYPLKSSRLHFLGVPPGTGPACVRLMMKLILKQEIGYPIAVGPSPVKIWTNFMIGLRKS